MKKDLQKLLFFFLLLVIFTNHNLVEHAIGSCFKNITNFLTIPYNIDKESKSKESPKFNIEYPQNKIPCSEEYMIIPNKILNGVRKDEYTNKEGEEVWSICFKIRFVKECSCPETKGIHQYCETVGNDHLEMNRIIYEPISCKQSNQEIPKGSNSNYPNQKSSDRDMKLMPRAEKIHKPNIQ